MADPKSGLNGFAKHSPILSSNPHNQNPPSLSLQPQSRSASSKYNTTKFEQSPPLPQRPTTQSRRSRKKQHQPTISFRRISSCDPVRKDVIVKSKDMYANGKIQRSEFLKILTGSFTNIAIDVAEDYTSSCDAIATNTDTEEEITLVLLPRVMELAKFLLSVSLLDLHTKADGQRLVSEYIALCQRKNSISTNAEQVLVPLLVHFCQHIFTCAGMDKLNWNSNDTISTDPKHQSSRRSSLESFTGDASHTKNDLINLPEGSIEFTVIKSIGTRTSSLTENSKKKKKKSDKNKKDNKKEKKKYNKHDGVYVTVIPLWNQMKRHDTNIIKYTGEETILFNTTTTTTTTTSTTSNMSNEDTNNKCKFIFPGSKSLINKQENNIMAQIGFKVILNYGNTKSGYNDIGHSTVCEAVQIFLLTPQMMHKEIRFQLVHDNAIKGIVVCSIRYLPSFKRVLPSFHPLRLSQMSGTKRNSAKGQTTSNDEEFNSRRNVLTRKTSKSLGDENDFKKDGTKERRRSTVLWPTLHKTDSILGTLSQGHHSRSNSSASVTHMEEHHTERNHGISEKKEKYIVDICKEAELKLITLYENHFNYGVQTPKMNKNMDNKNKDNRNRKNKKNRKNNKNKKRKIDQNDEDEDNDDEQDELEDDRLPMEDDLDDLDDLDDNEDEESIDEEDDVNHHSSSSSYSDKEHDQSSSDYVPKNKLDHCAHMLRMYERNSSHDVRNVLEELNEIEMQLVTLRTQLNDNDQKNNSNDHDDEDSKDHEQYTLHNRKIGIPKIDKKIETSYLEHKKMDVHLSKELKAACERITMQGIDSSQQVLETYKLASSKNGSSLSLGIPWSVTIVVSLILLAVVEKMSSFIPSIVEIFYIYFSFLLDRGNVTNQENVVVVE